MTRMHKRRPKAVRLFLFFILFFGFLFFCRKVYDYYELERQIREAEAIRQELLQEQQALADWKEELNDPDVVERKARDDLGMVKQGEVPYVK